MLRNEGPYKRILLCVFFSGMKWDIDDANEEGC